MIRWILPQKPQEEVESSKETNISALKAHDNKFLVEVFNYIDSTERQSYNPDELFMRGNKERVIENLHKIMGKKWDIKGRATFPRDDLRHLLDLKPQLASLSKTTAEKQP